MMATGEARVTQREWTAVDPGIGVLGEFQVLCDGQPKPARTRQVARLGALLAAAPGQTVTRDRIIEALWADKPPQTAVNTIQVHISQLRLLVGSDLIATTGQGYAMEVQADRVDAEWFRHQVLTCLDHPVNGDAGQVKQVLHQALDLWRGDPYEDLNDGLIEARRSELRELRERAIELYLDVSLALAESPREIGEVIADARGQVARQPLRERGHEILIRALIREENRAQAAQAYQQAIEVFAEQAGVTASPRLRRAVDPVLRGET